MGCCWDPTKQYHCFYANADPRALEAEKEQSGSTTTGHSAGFAAGMTALAFVILYAVAGTTYYFVKK